MNYHLKTKSKGNPSFRRAFLVVCVIFAFLGLLFLLNSRAPLSLLTAIGKPVWSMKQTASIFFRDNDGFLKRKQTLVEENNSLKQSLSDLTIASFERDILKEENRELKLIREESQEIARVLSTPIYTFYDSLIIELSKDSKAKAGDLVFAKGVVLLGEILDRSGSTARVKLFSSPGTLITLRLVSSGAELSVSGRGGGNFSVTVPSSLPIKEGDIFSYPFFTTNVVARVGDVRPAQLDSFNVVLSSYPVNIFELTWVGIHHVSETL